MGVVRTDQNLVIGLDHKHAYRGCRASGKLSMYREAIDKRAMVAVLRESEAGLARIQRRSVVVVLAREARAGGRASRWW